LSTCPFFFPPSMYHRYENIILSDIQNIFWIQNNTHTHLLQFLPAELGTIQLILHTNMYMLLSYHVWLTFSKLYYPASSLFHSASLFVCPSSFQGRSHVSEMLIDTVRSEKIFNWTLHVSSLVTQVSITQNPVKLFVLLFNRCYSLICLNKFHAWKS
jgi:hypothetical protein